MSAFSCFPWVTVKLCSSDSFLNPLNHFARFLINESNTSFICSHSMFESCFLLLKNYALMPLTMWCWVSYLISLYLIYKKEILAVTAHGVIITVKWFNTSTMLITVPGPVWMLCMLPITVYIIKKISQINIFLNSSPKKSNSDVTIFESMKTVQTV